MARPVTLVYEPTGGGHRFHYAGLLLRELQRAGCEPVLAVCEECLAQPDAVLHLGDCIDAMRRIEVRPILGRTVIQRSISRSKELDRVVGEVGPDRVYIPYADGIAQTAGILGRLGMARKWGMPVEALMMRGGFAYPAHSLWARWTLRASFAATRLNRWDVIHHLDPLAYATAKQRAPRWAERLRMIPEPVEHDHRPTKESARGRLGLSADARILATAGALDERKGVDRLVRAFLHVPNPQMHLLLAGRPSEGVREILESAEVQSLRQSGRLHWIKGYVDAETFIDVLAAADVVCVGYPRHVGSSGVLVRAAALGRPILASDWGWVAWAVRTFGLGRTVDVGNCAEFARAIEEGLAGDWPPYGRLAQNFARYHTVENYLAHWTAGIRASQGWPRDERMLRWEDLFGSRGLGLLGKG